MDSYCFKMFYCLYSFFFSFLQSHGITSHPFIVNHLICIMFLQNKKLGLLSEATSYCIRNNIFKPESAAQIGSHMSRPRKHRFTGSYCLTHQSKCQLPLYDYRLALSLWCFTDRDWEWNIRALNDTFVLFYRKIHTWSARQSTRTSRVMISTRDSVWICCGSWQTYWSFPSGSSWWTTGCMELQNRMDHGLAWWGNSSTGYACLRARP